jgi:hypothetical protein
MRAIKIDLLLVLGLNHGTISNPLKMHLLNSYAE